MAKSLKKPYEHRSVRLLEISWFFELDNSYWSHSKIGLAVFFVILLVSIAASTAAARACYDCVALSEVSCAFFFVSIAATTAAARACIGE